ncbi:MAG: alpha/beta fold hydrolase [Betaproteobacteria bacterium]|nr:alpha/beta fold hydrolase [Betaproteobacteria bacterium]
MIRLLLLAMLLTEALLYAWLANHLRGLGVDAWRIAAAILLFACLWRLSHALTSYLMAAAIRFKDRRSLPLGNSLAALASELSARAISFNWSQAFVGWAMGMEPQGGRAGPPILLVHGFFSNRGMWWRFRKRLAAAGLGPIYAVTLDPPTASIDLMAEQLSRRIDEICRATGAERIVVVAHSMGGLITRAYMTRRGGASILKLITLGSPHHGTKLAAFGIGTCAGQMKWQSPWLTTLAQKEAVAPHGVPTLSIYTVNDDLVYPPESSALPWAENVPVSAVGHVGLLFSDSVAERVIAAIRRG